MSAPARTVADVFGIVPRSSGPARSGPLARYGDRTRCGSIAELAVLWPGATFESDADPFSADALRLQFTRFRFETSTNSAYRCRRDRASIERFPRPAIAIETVIEGRIRRQQQGLDFVQTEGGLAITALDEPFEFAWLGPGRSVRTVAELSTLPPQMRELGALRSGPVEPSPLVASYVGFVRGLIEVVQPDAVEYRTLESSLFALHQAVLVEALRRPGSPRSLRARIEEHVHEHLADPELSPTRIAADLFVSLRAVHAAFNADGVTLAAEIRRQRVLAAVQLLEVGDPSTPLAAIGAQVGFASTERFRRSFVSVLGLTATEYRARFESRRS